MRDKLSAIIRITFVCALLITAGSAWKNVYAKGYTVEYSRDGFYNPVIWNSYISEDVNQRPLHVYVDGQAVKGDFYMNRDMKFMVPVDKITDCFNCAENMYGGNELVLQKKDTVLKFYKDQPDIYFVNDVQVEMKNSIEVVEGRCFVAADALVDNLGYDYYWDVQINTVDLVTVWQDTILPSYYNLQDVNRATAVKNQGNHGTCWAVAALSAMETTLRPEEETYFAAEHMALRNSFTKQIDEGGEFTMSMAYLLAWQGPVLESEDAYGDLQSPEGLSAAKHVQEIQIIKDKNRDKIKEAILKKGAVQTSIYSSLKSSASHSKYYKRENNAYCYFGDEIPNHEVIIIGWDDNYPKENFNIQPENNGAFICQNSWGENFGDNGIFYISYEDSQIGSQSVVYSKIENNDNFDNIYQTDMCGWVGKIGYGRETCYFANVFTARSNEVVKAVGFYTTGENTSYEIYKVPEYNDVSSLKEGELVAVGNTENSGFYTVDLNEEFKIEEGQRFSIVVRIYTPGEVYPVAVEYASEGRCETVDLSDGEGYISSYGDNWINVENDYNCNICMKLYTDYV